MKTKILNRLRSLIRDLKFERARWRALARLKKGIHLGWTPPESRDELHER